MDSKVRAPKPQQNVTEEDLLQGFKQFVRMLDFTFQPEDKTSVTAAEKLAAEYIRFFNNAARKLARQCMFGTLSWDAIIAATKDSLFFEANPEFLGKHSPDLKYKPSVEYKGLHQFAHSSTQLTSEVVKQLAAELMELRVFNKNLDVRRLLAPKEGLLRQKILIDDFIGHIKP
ncbi:hypothetical protein NA56DRAFT_652348 [Hyaloscypha hepaticicola]|uniref:Uncharacterized protein n=1 Tax=Hyaloscypha hepaticicola TaxID=2082293 RepID=A0A2J6PF37_9HELO|nr:hypothetical protein NA56DRAFT_652348 [Hyaloscypha hepaticicola]